jgi:hypothetical protein
MRSLRLERQTQTQTRRFGFTGSTELRSRNAVGVGGRVPPELNPARRSVLAASPDGTEHSKLCMGGSGRLSGARLVRRKSEGAVNNYAALGTRFDFHFVALLQSTSDCSCEGACTRADRQSFAAAGDGSD